MGTESDATTMTEGRGLLTESEREAIAGEASDSYRYKTRSYARSRIEKLAEDVELLKEHDPELLDELRDVVCEDETSEEMPICKNCNHRVSEATDDRGEYYCQHCSAVLRKEDTYQD